MDYYTNPPYYLTAYGLAVKYGYEGTEEEFVDELMNGAAHAAEAAAVSAAEALAKAQLAASKASEAASSAVSADASKDAAAGSAAAAAASETAAKNYADHIADPVAGLVGDWLDEHVDPATGYVIDDSLSIEGAAADAKAAGSVKSALQGSYADGIQGFIGSRPIVFEDRQYYSTPDVGGLSEKTTHSNWRSAKYSASPGHRVAVCGATTADNMRIIAFLDSNDRVLGRYAKHNYGVCSMAAPAGTAYVVVNLSKTQTGANPYWAYIGPDQKEAIDDHQKALNDGYPALVIGNFYGSHMWDVIPDSTITNIAMTDVIENIGICYLRSTIPGVKITVYGGEVSEGETASIVQGYDSVKIPEQHTYVRVRVQPGRSGIADLSSVLTRLLEVRYAEGLPFEVSELAQESSTLLKIEDTEYTESQEIVLGMKTYDPKNIVATVEAKFTGEAENEYLRPTIYIRSGFGSYTPRMYIGGKDEYRVNTLRFYPLLIPDRLIINVKIDVPTGLTLSVKSLQLRFDDSVSRNDTGIQINAHSSFSDAPQYSKRATALIAHLGAKRTIQLPKRSSDGVWFCYHDDTFDESTTFLRNADGTAISGSIYNGLPFAQIPYSYLYGLDWGVSSSTAFAGEKPQLLDEWFATCAKTGMHPMLSFHPESQSTIANFAEIRAMAKKHGVLKWLGVKFPAIVGNGLLAISRAFSVFGYDVESYTANVPSNGSVSAIISAFDSLGIDKDKADCVIEQLADVGASFEADVAEILDAGYIAGVSQREHTRPDGTTGKPFTGADYAYYTGLGVTVFTSGTFASYGLNW